MIIIGRPINGISLNGDEYLLDDSGEYMEFKNEDEAKLFLRDNGFGEYSEDELNDSFNFVVLYPFNEGDTYWTVEEIDGDYEDNISLFQRGVNAIQSTWDNISEELHTDSKKYFDSLESVMSYCRYKYDFIKVSSFIDEIEDITNGDYLVCDDEESGKYEKSY